jgi:hypothetical protein
MQRPGPVQHLSFVDADTAKAVNSPGGAAPPGGSEADRAVTALFRAHHVELVRLAVPPRVTPDVTAAAPAVPVPPYYVAANQAAEFAQDPTEFGAW